MVKFQIVRKLKFRLRVKGVKFRTFCLRMRKRLLWISIALLGVTWFIGRYLNNPLPPEMEEAWFYNLFTGGVALVMDLVSCN